MLLPASKANFGLCRLFSSAKAEERLLFFDLSDYKESTVQRLNGVTCFSLDSLFCESPYRNICFHTLFTAFQHNERVGGFGQEG